MKLNKKVMVTVLLLASFLIFTPSILAESKKQLQQYVLEHDQKIQELEAKLIELESSQKTEANPISEEKQKVLQREYEFFYKNLLTDFNTGERMNIVDTKFVNKDGKNVYQMFFEGSYQWELDMNDPTYNWGTGRILAYNFTREFNIINKMYGEDISIEYYQNNELVTQFSH